MIHAREAPYLQLIPLRTALALGSPAMKNEVLAKLVCHNIACLISAMNELGVDPQFWGAKRQSECSLPILPSILA